MPFVAPAQRVRPKPISRGTQNKEQQVQQESHTQTRTETPPLKNAVKTNFSTAASVVAVCELCVNVVSSIFYLRSIIPDDDFEDASIHVPAILNDDGTVKKQASELPIKLFKQGASAEGDEALGWMNFSLADALRRKYLKSFMIIVYLSEETRQKAVEAYTFNVGYDGDVPFLDISDDMGRLDVTTRSSTPVRHTKTGFATATRKLLREIYAVNANLPTLPPGCKFDFRLFYNESAPEDYQPPYFQPDDEGEVYLATHDAAEAPMTYECGTVVATGHLGLSCQVASVAHTLPPIEDVDPATMSDIDFQQASQQASQACRREADEDVEMRDIIWPLEKAIYGKISTTTTVAGSQLESLKVEPTSLNGFSYPIGQLLESGEIKAIPNGRTRWSDGPEDGGGVFRPSEPAVTETSIADKLKAVRARRPGYEGFSQMSQDTTQTLRREMSLWENNMNPSANVSQDMGLSSSQTLAQDDQDASANLDADGDVAMTEESAARLSKQQSQAIAGDPAPAQVTASDDSQTSGSSTTLPTTPSSNEFDPSSQREPVVPELARLARESSKALSKAASQTSVGKSRSKPKPKPKATQKKRATPAGSKSADKPSNTRAKKNTTPAKSVSRTKKPAAPTTKTVGKGKKTADSVEPLNIAQFETQTPMIPTPESLLDPIASFSSLQLNLAPGNDTSTSTNRRDQRPHPYRRPSFALSDDTRIQSQSQSQSFRGSQGMDLPIPQTHMRRIRTSRGIRGRTYAEMLNDLPPISEE